MGQGRAGVTEPPGTVSGSSLPSPLPSLTCAHGPRYKLLRAGGSWAEGSIGSGRLGEGSEGGSGPSPLPGAAGDSAGAAQRSPCGMRAAEAKPLPAARGVPGCAPLPLAHVAAHGAPAAGRQQRAEPVRLLRRRGAGRGTPRARLALGRRARQLGPRHPAGAHGREAAGAVLPSPRPAPRSPRRRRSRSARPGGGRQEAEAEAGREGSGWTRGPLLSPSGGAPGGREGLGAQRPGPPCNGSSSKNHDSHRGAGGGGQ